MPFVFKSCPIKGLLEIEPKIFGDKWGWFFDKERKLINKNTINNLKK